MVDFQSPGVVTTQVRKGALVLPGIATAIGGFLSYAQRGPVGVPILVTSVTDAEEVFGDPVASYQGQQLQDSLQNFFNEGGQSCYVVRYIGVGSTTGARTLTTPGAATAGSLSSSNNAFPVQLVDGDTFIGEVNGGGAITAHVVAKPATLTLTGGSYAAGAGGDSVTFQVNLFGVQIITTINLSAVGATQSAYELALNAAIGLNAEASGSNIVLTTDQSGTGAGAVVTAYGGAAQAKIGGPAAETAFSQVGGSNVVNSLAVTETDLAGIFNADFTGSTTTANTTNHSVTWASNLTGPSPNGVEFTGGTAVLKIAGFDENPHYGSTTGAISTITIDASSPGAWANVVGIQVTQVNTIITSCTTTAAGSTSSLVLKSANRLFVGDTISVTHLTDVERGVIAAINNNTVTFASPITVPSGGYTSADNVVLETFNLSVYGSDGTLLYPAFMNMRMSPTAGPNYFVNVINGASRSPIEATDLSAVAADPRPSTDAAAVLMTGGADGAAPVDDDIIGVPGPPPTGIYAFNQAQDVSFISSPGNTSVAVQLALEAYGSNRGEVFMFHDPPAETPSTGSGGVRDYITNIVSFSQSNSALHWPWVARLNVNSILQTYPPSGFVQGAFARTFQQKNFSQVAAGTQYGQLQSAIDLETIILEQGPEYNDFYPVGGNAILAFRDDGAGSAGICIFGSRTLDSTGEFGQINVQIIFNVARRQARIGCRFVNFLPNNTVTRAQVVKLLTATYREWRAAGILTGDTDADAFFIICDTTNNTPTIVNSGKMIVRVGLAAVRPTEFLEIDFELYTLATDTAAATQPGA